MAYSNNFGSTLPRLIMQRHEYRDADNTVADAINTIKHLQGIGRYDEAAEEIKAFKEAGLDLDKYILSMKALNYLDEETRNLEIYAKEYSQQIFYEEDYPEDAMTNDVWISGEIADEED